MQKHVAILISESEDPSIYEGFKISHAWVRKFMERNGLCFRTAALKGREKKMSQVEKVHEVVTYLTQLNERIQEFEVKPDGKFNPSLPSFNYIIIFWLLTRTRLVIHYQFVNYLIKTLIINLDRSILNSN